MHRSIIHLMLIFLLSGCNSFPGFEETVLLRTDHEAYIIDEQTIISLTVTNNLDEVIYYICTGQVYLEELDNGAVVEFWQVHGFEECLGPGPIEPSEKHIFNIRIDLSQVYQREVQPRMDETVRYRLRADLYHDNRFRKPLSPALAVSNTFRLTADSGG